MDSRREWQGIETDSVTMKPLEWWLRRFRMADLPRSYTRELPIDDKSVSL
jgi:hypothetical protein